MFYMHQVGWGWWVLMSLGTVAFWALVAYWVVVMVRGTGRDRSDGAPPSESPEDILKRRLAAGEISLDEYERLHEVLHPQPRDKAAA